MEIQKYPIPGPPSPPVEEGQYPTQPLLAILSNFRWGKLKSTCESHHPQHSLTKSPRPNHRTGEGSPPPTSYHSVTKGLCTAVPFTQLPCLASENELQGILKGRNTGDDTVQTSEPDCGMAGMLELSDEDLKITMINRLRALPTITKSRCYAKRDGHYKQRKNF